MRSSRRSGKRGQVIRVKLAPQARLTWSAGGQPDTTGLRSRFAAVAKERVGDLNGSEGVGGRSPPRHIREHLRLLTFVATEVVADAPAVGVRQLMPGTAV